jgi:iron complex outermembrane receptor protein
VDVDASFQFTPRWSASLAASYVDAKVDDDFVPCNDSNLDGVPDGNPQTDAQFIATMRAAGQSVALCRSDASINRFPDWNASLQSEYSFPVTPRLDVYLRGLWTYYPENDQRDGGGIVADSYSLLNVYAGIRDPKGAWELSLYGKNVMDADTVLSASGGIQTTSGGGLSGFFGDSGYFAVSSYTPRREFGVNVRYAFGSR